MLTHNDLKMLAAVSGPCLTVFQPLRDAHSGAAKPATRIIGAMQESDRLLAEKGFDSAERDEMLRPLLKIALNTDWTNRKGSLIMFRAPGFTMANFWPDTLIPRVHFGQEFLVLPLLPGRLSNRHFWLLALGINAVRLFRGSRIGLVETQLPKGVPKNLKEAGQFDQPDHSLRGRSSAGRSVGSMKGVQFGTSNEVKADRLHDFFKAIDRGVHPVMAQDPQPLILAAVTRELAIYRKLNTYSPVLSGAVHGSPDSLGVDVLFKKASELMSAYSGMAVDATLREMEEAASHGLLITDPAAVIEAARNGQVEELIVSPAAPGFDQHEETVNWASLATIRGSGKISIVNSPQVAGVAAILRFHSGDQYGNGIEQQAADELVQK
jgi:hypothetical protein